MRTKSHLFLQNVLSNNFDVVCITESWLNKNFYNSEFFDDRYELFRCDRDSLVTGHERGGEVMIALRRDLGPSHRIDMRAPPPADEVWISLPMRSSTANPTIAPCHHLHIICTYIAHSSQHESLLTSFYDRISEFIFDHPNDAFLILGDFNISYATWSYNTDNKCMDIDPNNNNLAFHTSDFMSISSLSQYNNQVNQNNRLLDLVFSNEPCQVSSYTNPLLPEDKHHKSLEIIMSVSSLAQLNLPNVTKKQFRKADFVNIRKVLASTDWEGVFGCMTDVESMVDYFYSVIDDVINKYVPSCNLKSKNKYPLGIPYHSSSLVKKRTSSINDGNNMVIRMTT